jgi:hypothetical protein
MRVAIDGIQRGNHAADLVALVQLVECVLQLALSAGEGRPQIRLLLGEGAVAQRQLMLQLVDGLPALL